MDDKKKALIQAKYNKQYYQDNKEYLNKVNKQWKQDNKERVNAQSSKDYFKDKKCILKRHKQWQQDNPEYRKQYYQDNKEKIAKQIKQYRQTLNGRIVTKACHHNRRAMTRGLTKAIIQSVYEDNIKKYGRLTCILCFKPIEFGNDSLDHLTPLSRGGSNDFSNLGISHLSCNCKKHTMTLKEWFAND